MQSNTLAKNWTVGGARMSNPDSNPEDYLQKSRTLDSKVGPSHSRPVTTRWGLENTWKEMTGTQLRHEPNQKTGPALSSVDLAPLRTSPGTVKRRIPNVQNLNSCSFGILMYFWLLLTKPEFRAFGLVQTRLVERYLAHSKPLEVIPIL